MTVGQAIRKMRESKGYSRDELAFKSGVNKNSIDTWENDHKFPSLVNLLSVADTLECTLDELVGRTTTPK